MGDNFIALRHWRQAQRTIPEWVCRTHSSTGVIESARSGLAEYEVAEEVCDVGRHFRSYQRAEQVTGTCKMSFAKHILRPAGAE